jgi:mono/diheme cytochrome c family protein
MSLQGRSCTHVLRVWIVGLAIAAFLLGMGGYITTAQEAKPASKAAKSGGNAALIARGKYIVEGVAMCGECHTPRLANWELDYSRWLAGGPVPYLPAQPQPDWPLVEPRLAGQPPANDAQMVTLLTTGTWITGKRLRSPMPQFRMSSADAEAVVAYLKSLTPGRDQTQ